MKPMGFIVKLVMLMVIGQSIECSAMPPFSKVVSELEAKEYGFSVLVKKRKFKFDSCTTIRIQIPAESSGDGIKNVKLFVVDENDEFTVDLSLSTSPLPQPENAKEKAIHVAYVCLPDFQLLNSYVSVTYGIPMTLCSGDSYTIPLGRYFSETQKER